MTKQEFLDKLQYRVTVLSQDEHYATMLSEESMQRAGFSDLLTFAFYQLSGWVPASDKTISEIADEADENVLSRMGNALASGTKVMWFKDGIALEDIKDREGSTNPIDLAKYDLNGDGQIDEDDVDVFVNGPDFVIMTMESNPEVMGRLNDNGVFEGAEMYRSQAAEITDDQISYVFSYSGIKTFDEFKYFTGITELAEDMFAECYSLTSITIPASVTSISDNAIYYCPSLESITVDPNNKVYDSRNNCNAIIETETNTLIVGCKTTVIPDSVTSIGNGAFSGCESLATITIPDLVTSIGNGAFAGCESLATITIPDSVTSIGKSVFSNCTSLASIIIPDSVTSIGDNTFSACSSLTTVTIGNSVTSIGDNTFSACSSLTTVTIGNSVTSIGKSIFSSCTSLTSIIIPDSVTSIGKSVFSNCTSLASITVNLNNTVYDSRNNCNAIIETETNTLIAGCKNTVIPNSVTSIGEEAFYYCKSLASIIIPDSVTAIGDYAFYSCISLATITCYNTAAPTIEKYTFTDTGKSATNKKLRVPTNATGYDGNWSFYLKGYTLEEFN